MSEIDFDMVVLLDVALGIILLIWINFIPRTGK